MNSERLYYGNLLECTQYDEVPHMVSEEPWGITMLGHIDTKTKQVASNVLLLKTKNGYYVPIDESLSALDIAFLYMENTKRIYGGTWEWKHFLSSATPSYIGEVTVDPDSLVPYSQTKGSVSLLAERKKNSQK